MNYIDRIYGAFEIQDPVSLDIINSPSLQRLKDIDLGGYSELYFPGSFQSRFEHSMGVYLLLKKYKASLEEQISGLLHDISHSAFSHCIDYVLDEGSEAEHNLQDNIFESFIKNTEIPHILKKHNIKLDYIIDDKNFPLKEQNLPSLCADRIDYSLRSAVVFKEISSSKAQEFLEHLKILDGRWIFDNFEDAKQYAELFLKLNNTYFSGLPSAIMFKTIGDYLKYGLKQNYISHKDLYTTDKEVLAKLLTYHLKDQHLQLLCDRLYKKIDCYNNPKNYESLVHCKSRIIDPLCLHQDKVVRISEIDPLWKKIVQFESMPKKYFLHFKNN